MAKLPDFDKFLPISQNSTIYTDLAAIRPFQWSFNPLSPTCSLRTMGLRFPVQWQYCQFSMYFFQFNQNSTIYTDLIAIRHLQCQNQPFVIYLLAEDPGPSIANIVAILPYVDGFLPILSRLNHLYRCNRHPTLQCQNLPFVSVLLAEDQGRPIPVQ